MNKIKLIAALAVIALIFLVVTRESKDNLSYIELKRDATILAFGDSITYGYGVPQSFSYPSQLQKKTGLRVINAGVSGEESSDGLLRLPPLLKEKPALVILCHGGNDIIRKRSDEKLKSNLIEMINLIKASGAKVLLVGVPNFGMLGFKTHSLYEEVAGETEVFFEEDVLSMVEADNRLKIDAIHPNEKGYKIMVEAFIKHLKFI
ncbi:MAG: arylesterase [Sulfurimonas sp. RIFCSPLOWO2_12_36_12]|uniref:arylesterase n=1 Tax=Sulfurimonas sp. RIFCSPLOWO2_12_36_12 TaxID=1802253 RepID=UPI0008B4F7F0|nr:arylesterase [Sulfurimonas sp. RIFCSPLOWO2_12_36_12]OHE00500.1 MAG: arylesterase [Sulfurimonas sp. RIFCSPLOWO2_02_FULL_36_28]OHE01039.1 MAG: arylesterase [Sulfurimonas sp. RIFCSPLOWO2_12_36_12]